jgi:hypothetical protein
MRFTTGSLGLLAIAAFALLSTSFALPMSGGESNPSSSGRSTPTDKGKAALSSLPDQRGGTPQRPVRPSRTTFVLYLHQFLKESTNSDCEYDRGHDDGIRAFNLQKASAQVPSPSSTHHRYVVGYWEGYELASAAHNPDFRFIDPTKIKDYTESKVELPNLHQRGATKPEYVLLLDDYNNSFNNML